MTLVNLLGEGEKVLVVSQGYFGQRMGDIAEIFGFEYDVIESPWGSAVQPEQLRDQLDKKDYSLVVVPALLSGSTLKPLERKRLCLR